MRIGRGLRFRIGILCRLLIILMAVPVVPEISAQGTEGWKQVLLRDGIQIFTRPSSGQGHIEFMGRTIIDSPLSSVEKVIDDVPGSAQWLPDCREARVIRTMGGSTRKILFVTDEPWPFSDREALLISHKDKDPGTGRIVIGFHGVNDPSVPVRNGNVRIPSIEGAWVLMPVDRNRTQFSYRVKGDPGGSIPGAISRRIAWKIPYNTLLGLKDAVRK